MENNNNIKLKVKLIIINCTLLLILFVGSCNNMAPEDAVKEYDMYIVPRFIYKAIDIPSAMQESPDSIAQMLVTYFTIYNETEKYLDLLNFENKRAVDFSVAQPWVKTIQTNEGLEITVTLQFDNEIYYNGFPTNCIWEVFLNGRDSVTGNFYNNWNNLTASLLNGDLTALRLNEENSDNMLYYLKF
jgi:hypothetical protein